MKKIWLLCLCLASLSLVWCFHIPDEDWLPSKNKVNTWDTQKDEEMQQALDSFVDWINNISSERDEINSNKNVEITTEDVENDEEIIDEEVRSWEVVDEVVEENVISEE